MEYEVRIKNHFNRAAVLELLLGRGAQFDTYGLSSLSRPYLPGTHTALSPSVLAQLHRATRGQPPVHDTTDFALYFRSSLGGHAKDYYRLDSRTIIYDRLLRWGYWDRPAPNEVAVTGASGHIMPIPSPVVTSEFGPRGKRIHWGLDMAHTDRSATEGLPIRATMAGCVVRVVYELDGDAGGIRVAILAKNGIRYNYYHMQHGSNQHIKMGQKIAQGDVIGKVGRTGDYDLERYPAHLHYEMWRNNNRNSKFDPEEVHPETAKLPRRL